ncbi:MAG: hypothetical protein R3B68_12865 [Phycisphaerales bacterium]
MPPREPIPRDLWLRLWSLDGSWDCSLVRCDARVEREEGRYASSLNFRRWWVARLWPTGHPDRAVGSSHPRLARALAGAVALAEQAQAQQPPAKRER